NWLTFRPSERRASSYRLVTTRFSNRRRTAMQVRAIASIAGLFFSLSMILLVSLLVYLYMQYSVKSSHPSVNWESAEADGQSGGRNRTGNAPGNATKRRLLDHFTVKS